MRGSIDGNDTWRLEERRREARYTLILRAGVLEQAGRTSFCLVRNISSAGVQLKVYTPPVEGASATLRVADEQPVAGRVAWINGDNAGLSLDEELDAVTLLRVQQKMKPHQRRAFPRVDLDTGAILRTGGRTLRVRVLDLSSLGARISGTAKLSRDHRVIVELTDLPSIAAYVRWVGESDAGLVFETPIPMQIIAHWIEANADVLRFERTSENEPN